MIGRSAGRGALTLHTRGTICLAFRQGQRHIWVNSTDGAAWTELKTDSIWSERHEQSYYVFEDKLWLVGGNAWPLVNDVWRLDLPAAWGKTA